MALPIEWVDAIFARLVLAYGVRFMAQYGALQPDDVKASWAATLDGVTSGAVKHAYDNLPPEHPPNALQFRQLCRQYRMPERPALAAPGGRASPEDIARLNTAVAAFKASKNPKAWAYALKAREEAGERLNSVQRNAWRSSVGTAVHRASDVQPDDGAVTHAVEGPEK